MIRHASALAVALCLSPAWLCAQTTTDPSAPTVLTVKTASADVHNSPSLGSAVIGHASSGAVLEVTRELGSWVKVSWPAARDGVGYVHVSAGTVGRAIPPAPVRQAALTSTPPAPESAPTAMRTAAVERAAAPGSTAPLSSVYVSPSTHRLGFGARAGGPTLGYGASARAWSHDRFGAQFEVSRYAITSAEAPGDATSIQFEPSFLYTLPDHVGDYLWVRPYLGGGANFRHQTLKDTTPGATSSASENKVGFQVFGGGELTFAGLPRFAVSLDLGYHHAPTSFAGVDFGGIGASVAGHLYVK